MNKALEIYAHILKEYLSKCFANGQNINPVELNKERFKVKAVFISSFLFLKNNPENEVSKVVSATDDWLKNLFGKENLFSLVFENTNEILRTLIDANLYNLTGIELINTATLYENLLSIETETENFITKTSTAKNYRNKLGSYYTPFNLAKAVTIKTIDAFFELNYQIKELSLNSTETISDNLLKEISLIRFADFSCGGGNFLLEVIEYFDTLFTKWNIDKSKQSDLLKSIILNISAVDVDCIALEVAKLNLLLRIKQPFLYSSLKEHFIHANFLLQTDSSISEFDKIDFFSRGFIYHEQLSLNRDRLEQYDVILGNPPWEKIRFEEKKFYALYSIAIANNHFKTSRSNEISETKKNNAPLGEFSALFKNEIEKAKSNLKQNAFFSLSNKGELNTYLLFTDAAIKLRTQRGVIGLVLKSATVTSQVNQKLFKFLTKENLIIAIYDFINRKKIFDIDSRERFCFLLLGNSKSEKFYVAMNLIDVDEIQNSVPKISLTNKELKLLNPFTGMLPNFSTKEEVDFLLRISYEFPFFKNVYNEVRFGRIVHLTNHSDFIEKKRAKDNLPIYEGKFFNQFDGKFSGFNYVEDNARYGSKSSSILLDEQKKGIDDYLPESRFFIKEEKWKQLSKNHNEKFMLAWRSLTSATNTRTCIATVLPFIPASQSVQFLTTGLNNLLYLSGLFNSVVFDFILKKKLSGIDLTQSVINQIPVPNEERVEMKIDFNGFVTSIKEHISLLVYSLLKNDARLSPLFESLKLTFELTESRFEIIRKIDLLFMVLYGLSTAEIRLILSAFRKQYSDNDFDWFKKEFEFLLSYKAVGSSIPATPTFSPF